MFTYFIGHTTKIGQNRRLFEAYQSIADSAEFSNLDTAQQKIINDTLRDFRLAGVALEDKDKVRYGEIKQQLSELTSQFSITYSCNNGLAQTDY